MIDFARGDQGGVDTRAGKVFSAIQQGGRSGTGGSCARMSEGGFSPLFIERLENHH